MSDDDLTTVLTVSNAMRAEMIVGYLREHGIRVFAVGAQHSAIMQPLTGPMIQIPLRVPKSQLDEARALIEALQSDEVDEEREEEPEAEPAADEPDPSAAEEDRSAGRSASEPSSGRRSATPLDDPPRKAFVAAFLAFLVMPGLAQVYVREYGSAALIGLTATVLFLLNFSVPYEYSSVVGVSYASLYLIGAVEGARSAGRRNRGIARPASAQLVVTALYIAAGVCVGLIWNELARPAAPS